MSRIDDLLDEQCRDGVEFLEIGELVERTENIQWSEHDGETFKYIDLSSVDRTTNKIIETALINRETAPSRAQQIVREGDVLFGTTRPMLRRCCLVDARHDGQIASTGFCVLRPNSRVSSEWLYHMLGTPKFYEHVEVSQRGASYPSIANRLVRNFRIPVPPLAIQRAVAEGLSKMESLKAELESELESELDYRSRQYAHYRDSLLTFGSEEVRRRPFGEVASIVRGASPRPIRAFLTDADDGINWIKIGDVPAGGKYITSTSERIKPEGVVKSRRVEPGDFVLSNSMSFGRPYILKIHGCIHDGWLAIKDFDEAFDSDFLYHLLRSTPVYRELSMRASAGTVQNLNADIVKSLILPVPDLEDQRRIAAILDKFDALVNDLSIRLPAEISARRQQYEYYRDQLLTFPEKAS